VGLAAPALPRVVRPVELQGLAHVHTTWSDGQHGVVEMARAARGLGFAWLAITDHSPSANANGLTLERLKAQREDVERAREAVPGIAILHGAEVDIREDGRLDHDDETLAWLDVVVASLHGPLDRDEATQTRRLVAALRHPLVGWLGHPTGRYYDYHPGYRVDLPALIAAAAEAGRGLEVNGTPGRLDLSARDVRRAVAGGAKVVAAADAHAVAHLGRSFHAAHTAARGGATAADVLTTLPVDGFLRATGRPALADRYAAARRGASAGGDSRASSARS
jgi:DNA polymerase (family 10)